jgi:hypothetical protein
MFKSTLITAVAVMGLNATAEGFRCEAAELPLAIKVYGATLSSPATREAQVMVISDTSVSHGSKTIARFTKADGTLSNQGANYVGNVDLRFADISRSGENIAGTKLGEVDRILLAVDFSYVAPIEDGQQVAGTLYLTKRNGDSITVDLECIRYLKN